MKKIFTSIFAIALSINALAQCPLTTAVDFTANDVHGTEIHLFDILDGGQSVLIDFFFTTCGPCQTATPKIVESYYSFGCNQHDVFYMEISDRDSDAACQTWVANYGVEYPTISGAAGGSTICNQYQIGAFPTVILIKPDHSIVINDLWPINNAQTIVNALENQGIQQYECGETPQSVVITPLDTHPDYPDDIYIVNSGCIVQQGSISINNLSDETLVVEEFSGDFPDLGKIEVSWNAYVGGVNIIDEPIIIAPSETVFVYVEILPATCPIAGTYFGTITITTSADSYEVGAVYEYGGDGIYEYKESSVVVFPNPANDFVKISGENIGTISVYNIFGQKMGDFEVNNDEYTINTSNYENGVYFVKIGEKTQRFVVEN